MQINLEKIKKLPPDVKKDFFKNIMDRKYIQFKYEDNKQLSFNF